MKFPLLPLIVMSLLLGLHFNPSTVIAAEKTAESKAATEVHHVQPEAADSLIREKKVVVLDIRTGDEFSGGHIAGAKNLDFFDADFKAQLAKLDHKQPYLVHCASGGRSTQSLQLFKDAGFQQVYHLDGGIKAWQKAGKPVVK